MEEKNLDIYGDPPIPWSRALEQLEAAPVTQSPRTTWLSTVRPDGRPHLAGIGALWVDGKFYFTSGPGTRKSRNLAANPNCALSMALPGLDLVVEGFNILNRQNVIGLDPVFGSGSSPRPGFARAIDAANARHVQFSVDFEF